MPGAAAAAPAAPAWLPRRRPVSPPAAGCGPRPPGTSHGRSPRRSPIDSGHRPTRPRHRPPRNVCRRQRGVRDGRDDSAGQQRIGAKLAPVEQVHKPDRPPRQHVGIVVDELAAALASSSNGGSGCTARPVEGASARSAVGCHQPGGCVQHHPGGAQVGSESFGERGSEGVHQLYRLPFVQLSGLWPRWSPRPSRPHTRLVVVVGVVEAGLEPVDGFRRRSPARAVRRSRTRATGRRRTGRRGRARPANGPSSTARTRRSQPGTGRSRSDPAASTGSPGRRPRRPPRRGR